MNWVTHFVRCPPEADGWLELPFITKGEGSSGYHWGVDGSVSIPCDELEERLATGELEELTTPTPLGDDQSVWLSSEGDIWVADEVDPIADRYRVLAKVGVCPPPEEGPAQSVLERIGTRKEDVAAQSVGGPPRPRILGIDKEYVEGVQYKTFAGETLASASDAVNGVVQMIPPESVQWDTIPNEVVNGGIDFCLDPFFLTGVRARTADVVQFGWIENITLFVERQSPLFEIVSGDTSQELDTALSACMAGAVNFQLGIFGATPSASELLRRIRRVPGLHRCLHRFYDHREMRRWVGEDTANRLIVCDVGMAVMLESVTEADLQNANQPVPARFQDQRFMSNLPQLDYSMEKRAKVGFVFPPGDQRWEQVIATAVGSALMRIAPRLIWDLHESENSVARELRRVGVSCFPFEKMCEKFLAAQQVEQAIRIQEQRRRGELGVAEIAAARRRKANG